MALVPYSSALAMRMQSVKLTACGWALKRSMACWRAWADEAITRNKGVAVEIGGDGGGLVMSEALAEEVHGLKGDLVGHEDGALPLLEGFGGLDGRHVV